MAEIGRTSESQPADAVNRIQITEEITLVTLIGMSANLSAISELFCEIAAAGINVDMISQSPPMGGTINLHFTIKDDDLGVTLSLLGKNKGRFPVKRLEVTSGNIKLNFSGELMREFEGVAGDVFCKLALLDVAPKLVTTSETDISVLSANLDLSVVAAAFERDFHVTPQFLG